MNDTQAQTESLLDIIKGIDNGSIMLPEFQRDFRWELSQTCDLFDSLIREIFIGTIIYGKPSFGMTLREIDTRPRRGKGSNKKLNLHTFSNDEIKKLASTKNLRVVLDGQQRITSIYRALKGKDAVYIILKKDLIEKSAEEINSLDLEDMVESVGTDEEDDSICVRVSDAFDAEEKGFEDDDYNERFENSKFAKKSLDKNDEPRRKLATRIYRRAARKLIDLFKQQKLVAFYMLDMGLNKFCIFFERSNSRGIQLNFTDILAAKLYGGFNLRQKIDDFEVVALGACQM